MEEFNEKCGVQYGHIFEVLRHIEEQWNARLKLEKNPFDELTQIQVRLYKSCTTIHVAGYFFVAGGDVF